MAWGIARRGKELEFTVTATKEEPHPGWENKVTGGAAYREESHWGQGSNPGISGRFWGDLRSLGSHKLMEAV